LLSIEVSDGSTSANAQAVTGREAFVLHVRVRILVGRGIASMLGWMLIFTLLSITAAVAGVTADTGFNLGMAASIVFAFLLIASLLTRALRGQS
jgi:hypothetical protein